jgi:membrane-associated protease RseP (regulator of RpoE activity)
MLDDLLSRGALVALFYVAVALGIYAYRDKFEFEGIIAMYRTKLGLKWMDQLANNYPTTMRWLGITGIAVCYAFMGLMLLLVAFSIYTTLFVPDAPPAFTPILPGVPIPGSPVYLPFFQGFIAIAAVVALHEFAHGVISRAFDIDVKSSGFALLGPLPGAFVEPDEDQLEAASSTARQSMFAAGPYWNLLLAIPIFFVVAGGVALTSNAHTTTGTTITGFVDNTTDAYTELSVGDTITGIDNQTINSTPALLAALQQTTPNQTVQVSTTEKTSTVTLAQPPRGDAGYLGITARTAYQPRQTTTGNFVSAVGPAWYWFMGDFRGYVSSPWQWPIVNVFSPTFTGQLGLLGWIFLVTTGLAGANLLPIGPLDGGRMVHDTLQNVFAEQTADAVMAGITKTLFLIVLFLLFYPIITSFF